MAFSFALQNGVFSLSDVTKSDLTDFIYAEKVSHHKYVAKHRDFFGDWNEQILIDSFNDKLKMTYFQKILKGGKTVGFLSYNRHDDKIDSVFIRLMPEIQNNGIGTMFLSRLKELSKQLNLTLFLVAIKTNPAHKLYRKLGFECYSEDDVFFFFRYNMSK